jgi:hypothetical protein
LRRRGEIATCCRECGNLAPCPALHNPCCGGAAGGCPPPGGVAVSRLAVPEVRRSPDVAGAGRHRHAGGVGGDLAPNSTALGKATGHKKCPVAEGASVGPFTPARTPQAGAP